MSLANGGSGKKPAGWFESGYLKQADTIEELAEQIGVDPATLRATVDRWNGFVDKGKDEDFHRGDARLRPVARRSVRTAQSRTLGRIDKAPFYAVDVVRATSAPMAASSPT